MDFDLDIGELDYTVLGLAILMTLIMAGLMFGLESYSKIPLAIRVLSIIIGFPISYIAGMYFLNK